jgi:hypothetical protein
MSKTKSSALEAHGWRVAAAKDFLELTPEESAFLETKVALTRSLRARRVAQGCLRPRCGPATDVQSVSHREDGGRRALPHRCSCVTRLR